MSIFRRCVHVFCLISACVATPDTTDLITNASQCGGISTLFGAPCDPGVFGDTCTYTCQFGFGSPTGASLKTKCWTSSTSASGQWLPKPSCDGMVVFLCLGDLLVQVLMLGFVLFLSYPRVLFASAWARRISHSAGCPAVSNVTSLAV